MGSRLQQGVASNSRYGNARGRTAGDGGQTRLGNKIYRDQGQTGAKENRPSVDALRADLRRGKIDVVMVWSLDRLARSLRHLLQLSEEFHSLGVDLCVAKQAIDTTSPSGTLTFQVLGAVAEFEREILRERVRAGLQPNHYNFMTA